MHLGTQNSLPFPLQSAPPSSTSLLVPSLPPALSQPLDGFNMEDFFSNSECEGDQENDQWTWLDNNLMKLDGEDESLNAEHIQENGAFPSDHDQIDQRDMEELINFLFDEADSPSTNLSPSPLSHGLQQPNSCSLALEKDIQSSSSSSSWAGPTLLDLQSALRIKQQQLLQRSTSMSSSSMDSSDDEPKPASSTVPTTQKHVWIWRKLEKGRDMEPRHVLRIRSESDVVEDGYKWRKYGQKRIKNNPYPRSYYRCSTSNKCGAKKQVERSREEPGIVNVKYEGLHLHHRPYPFISSSSIIYATEESASASATFPHKHQIY